MKEVKELKSKQLNYNVGIYLRLSKDEERVGESLSIEKAEDANFFKKELTRLIELDRMQIYDVNVEIGK